MSITPIFSSPCDLAERMPLLVADFLDLETCLHRRFREESISDIIVASLIRLSSAEIIVLVPKNETKTGNDFDIIIVDAAAREAVRYRIQAKRLKPHPNNWEISSYPELAHPNGTGAQSLSLIRSAAASRKIRTVPLYAFYNPTRTCAASGGVVSGIELADGRAIRSIIRELIRAKPKRPPMKRISTLRPLFFPLSRILCPDPSSSGTRRKIPTPTASFAQATLAMEEGADRFFGPSSGIQTPRLADLRESDPRADFLTLRIPDKLTPVLRIAFEQREAFVEDRIITANVERPSAIIFSDQY
jgi:hypothetical protein